DTVRPPRVGVDAIGSTHHCPWQIVNHRGWSRCPSSIAAERGPVAGLHTGGGGYSSAVGGATRVSPERAPGGDTHGRRQDRQGGGPDQGGDGRPERRPGPPARGQGGPGLGRDEGEARPGHRQGEGHVPARPLSAWSRCDGGRCRSLVPPAVRGSAGGAAATSLAPSCPR